MIEFQNDVCFILKIIIIGEPSVGKTSLIRNFIGGKIEVEYKPTIGTDLFHNFITTEKGVASLAIWDIAGQSKWQSFRQIYYTGARGGLVVYDCSRLNTFRALENWFEDVRKFLPDIPLILIENKIDLKNKELITQNEIQRLKEKYDLLEFYKSSAKTGENVEKIFKALANELVDYES
ncbi:MAG: GTP-binding protein [Candidatus Lokiarchaeota archaeon]|nr:GTP-binding protein [Candidatus Lokiarchaeota archaeon]